MTPLQTFTILVLISYSVTEALNDRVTESEISRVLATYVTRDPPHLDRATEVSIGLYINSFLPDQQTGNLRMSHYFRMRWEDPRLVRLFDNTEEDVKTVLLDDESISQIWRPDIFVRNSDGSERVDSLVKEHLCKVNRTGSVWFVVRHIENIHCSGILRGHRNLACSIMFESFKYTMDTLYFIWLDSPVDIDRDVHVGGYTLKDVILFDCSQNYTSGAFPCLEVKFLLRHDTEESTFETGIYLITSLLVFISWLGFWIPPSEKRVFLGLGVTLILAVLYVAVAEWRDYSYTTRIIAAQFWMIFCTALVLAMAFEYVLVYVLLGTVRARLKGLCGGTAEEQDMKPTRSRRADIVDSICGLVIFPAVYIIVLITFGLKSRAFI